MTNNITVTMTMLNEVLAQDRLFNTVLMSLFLVIGTFGNTVVISVYVSKMTLHRRNRYFLPALASIDIIACTSGSTFSILRNEYRVLFPSEVLCKTLWYVTSSATSVSAVLLLFIAVARHRKVCLPRLPDYTTKQKSLAFIIAIMSVAVLAIPMISLHGYRRYTNTYQNVTLTGHTCTDKVLSPLGLKLKLVYYATVFFILIILLATMTMLYFRIGRTVHTRLASDREPRVTSFSTPQCSNSVSPTNEESSNIPQRWRVPKTRNAAFRATKRKARSNFNLMFLTVTITYVVSYVPTLIFLQIPADDPDDFWFALTRTELNIYLILSRMYLISHVSNPFIYLHFDLIFRKQLLSSISRFSRRCIESSS